MSETPTPHVLVVTSASSPPSVVVPVLAALEAGGMRVHAIDIGATDDDSMAGRVRRALLGESAERRLRKELESNPPDVAIAFEPAATLALVQARDHTSAPAPVVAVVAELEPSKAWAETGADRFCAADAECAVALCDHGVDGDRVLVVGPVGPRAWADAGLEPRDAVRGRFRLTGAVALIEVAGMGAEGTAGIAMQLSLSEIGESTTFLFDAGADVDAAATLRARVPILGLRAKLFGATSADAASLWRAADVVVARPRVETVAKTALVGAWMVPLVDDAVAGSARIADQIEARKLGVAARSPLLISPALEGMLKRGAPPRPAADGAETVADVVWVIAGDRRAVLEERRAAERADMHDKVRAATTAARAAARVAAAPGELEDLGGDPAPAGAPAVDPGDLSRLVAETQARKKELEREMMAARDNADKLRKRGDGGRADEEQRRMHALLAELGQLETELRELERAVGAAPRTRPAAPTPPPRSSLDDQLAALKREGATTPPPRRAPGPTKPTSTVEDELAALKRKMEQTPRKK